VGLGMVGSMYAECHGIDSGRHRIAPEKISLTWRGETTRWQAACQRSQCFLGRADGRKRILFWIERSAGVALKSDAVGRRTSTRRIDPNNKSLRPRRMKWARIFETTMVQAVIA
jgi:hypothetical protein